MASEVVECIVSFLDVATFACAAAPTCRFFGEIITADSFEGWLVEIKRLHRISPWASKTSMQMVAETNLDIQARCYRTALTSLDREFAVNGWKLIPESLRMPKVYQLPPFFQCREDTLVYLCGACGSAVAPVDFTVGRGVMGAQEPAFILQPHRALPFCCAIHNPRKMGLSSGTYVLIDLSCPNKSCTTCLGWKYEDCVPDSDPVPLQNLQKIGQFWMFARSLRVVTPEGSFQGCSGEQFYFMRDI
jgi:hypothetical protein